jgi:hypothetical protein
MQGCSLKYGILFFYSICCSKILIQKCNRTYRMFKNEKKITQKNMQLQYYNLKHNIIKLILAYHF